MVISSAEFTGRDRRKSRLHHVKAFAIFIDKFATALAISDGGQVAFRSLTFRNGSSHQSEPRLTKGDQSSFA
jgi:hypothetical protein